MEIFCTKKLAGQLPVPLQKRPAPGPAFQRWRANLVTVQRRKTVLLTHEATLFTVVLWDVRRTDLLRFEQTVWQAVHEALSACGVKEEVLRQFLPKGESVVLKAAHMENRAAQSAMSCASRRLQGIWERECVPNALLQLPAGTYLNEFSGISVKNSDLAPMQAMELLLRELSGQEPIAQDYIRLRASLSVDTCKAVREVFVPQNYSFHQLHLALQRIFQWTGAYCHLFVVPNELNVCYVLDTSAGTLENPNGPAVSSRTAVLEQFLRPGQSFDYAYNFRIPWDVELEVLGRKDRVPTWGVICTDSCGISPPDELQSVKAFLNCLHAFRTPGHPRHAEAAAWLRGRSPTAEEINRWL